MVLLRPYMVKIDSEIILAPPSVYATDAPQPEELRDAMYAADEWWEKGVHA